MPRMRPSEIVGLAVLALAGVIALAAIAVGKTTVSPPRCASCHSAGSFTVETKASAHAGIDCARCHVPADGASRVAFASRVVFGMQLKMLPAEGRSIAAVSDATCLSCHQQVLKGVSDSKGKRIDHSKCATGASCTSCHSGVAHGSAVKWRRSAEMNTCLRCHNAEEVRRDCDTCHEAKSKRERLGTGAWQTTHGENWRSTHGMGDLPTCSSCHIKEYCVKCHGVKLPHGEGFLLKHGGEAGAQGAKCGTCHQKKAFCDACHGISMPHAPDFTKRHSAVATSTIDDRCLKCHVRDDCTNCHAKHVHPGGAKPPSGPKSSTEMVPR